MNFFIIALLSGASSYEGAEESEKVPLLGSEGSAEDFNSNIPEIGEDLNRIIPIDLMNCLCSFAKPVGSDFDCSFNLTPTPTLLGGSPSCGDLKLGSCMCHAIGCFRTRIPTSGECYNACRNQYPSIEPWVDSEYSEIESEEELPSPGNLVPAASIALNRETAPNDQIGDANEIKFASPANVSGRIAPAGDIDFFKFYAGNPGILTVKFLGLPPEMKVRIGIFGKNFNWIVNKDASNPGDTITLEKDVGEVGTCYVVISDLDRKAHSDSYTMMTTLTGG